MFVPDRKMEKRGFVAPAILLVAVILLLSSTSSNFLPMQDNELSSSSQAAQDMSPPSDEMPPLDANNDEDPFIDEEHSAQPDVYASYAGSDQENNEQYYAPQEDLEHIEPITITEYMRSSIDSIAALHGAVGVQIAIIQNGEIIGTHEFGYATKNSMQMTSDTKIRVASLSKPILAMLAIRLHEEGMIDIDADIGEYWGMTIRNPSYPDIPITIRHLITHTSSIYSFDQPFQSSESAHRSQLRAGNFFTERQPGKIESWHYSNFGYCFLGVTLEIATYETVNSLANRFFFEPLGIDAAFGSGSIADTENLATLYRSDGRVSRSLQVSRDALGSTFPGQTGLQFTGGLTISAGDYAKLIAALIGVGEFDGTQILRPESVALINSSHGTVLGGEMQGITTEFNKALAFRLWTNVLGQDKLFWHTGGAFGVAALAAFNPVNGNGVIVLTTGANLERRDNYIHIICAEIAEFVFQQFNS